MEGHKIITRKQTFVINCTHNIFFCFLTIFIYIYANKRLRHPRVCKYRSKYSCVFRHEPIKSKITCPLPDALRC